MPVSAFISYAHADSAALERLHKHLVMLRREGSLTTWVDHAILPGADLDQDIEAALNGSDLFLALVSPDYLDSKYCFEREYRHALAREAEGAMRIVPIILEPCDWQSAPFKKIMALPKDGKPISDWTNPNSAYLNVVEGIRRLMSTPAESPTSTGLGQAIAKPARRVVRLRRDFDAIEKADFAADGFRTIRDYFRDAATELEGASEDIRVRFEEMSASAFTCSVVNRAQRRGEAHITVRHDRSRHGLGDITYIDQAHAESNGSNGGIRVQADEYNLYFTVDSFFGSRDQPKQYTAEAAAEWLWNQFVAKAGIEYD